MIIAQLKAFFQGNDIKTEDLDKYIISLEDNYFFNNVNINYEYFIISSVRLKILKRLNFSK